MFSPFLLWCRIFGAQRSRSPSVRAHIYVRGMVGFRAAAHQLGDMDSRGHRTRRDKADENALVVIGFMSSSERNENALPSVSVQRTTMYWVHGQPWRGRSKLGSLLSIVPLLLGSL
jgi:hypothetical protein